MPEFKIEENYININDFSEVKRRIDDKYFKETGDKLPKCYDERILSKDGPAALRRYWGIEAGPGGRLEIGVHGKVRALCALTARSGRKPRTWRGLADAIIQEANQSQGSGKLPPVRDALEKVIDQKSQDHPDFERRHRIIVNANPKYKKNNIKLTIKDIAVEDLISLISVAQSRWLPPERLAEHYLELVAGYFASAFAQSGQARNIDDVHASIWSVLVGQSHEAPSACAEALAAKLGLQGASSERGSASPGSHGLARHPVHVIDPSIQRYITAADERAQDDLDGHGELNEIVERVKDGLSVIGKKPNSLVVLTGGAHVGKKAVIGDLIRSLRDDGEGRRTICLDVIRNGQKVQNLPVFAIDAHGCDYLALVSRILDFLIAYKAVTDRRASKARERATGREDDARIREMGLEWLLKRVEELHCDCPAFFIISDVDGSRGDSLLKILRNYGINRLLRTLLASNKESRVLVTESEADTRAYETIRGSSAMLSIRLPQPTITRLGWYLPQSGALVAEAIDALPSSERKVQTTGTALIALAARLRAVEHVNAD